MYELECVFKSRPDAWITYANNFTVSEDFSTLTMVCDEIPGHETVFLREVVRYSVTPLEG